MKILHIHPSMAGGGIESMICALANEMSNTEDVSVCSIFEPKDVDIFWYKLNSKVKKSTLGKRKSGFSLRVLWNIFRFIRKGDYDVVNLHGMFYYYIIAVVLLHHKISFFYTVHSDAVMENSIWDKRLLRVKKFCFNKGWLHSITISKVSQLSFTNLYNSPSNLIFNGVPSPEISEDNTVNRYRINDNTRVFIHAGRVSVPKNQLTLCKVFKCLIDDGYDVVLLIAGSIQSCDIFNALRPFFNERIVYLGQRDDVAQLMAYSDAMCLPSLWEGLPVTLLEALSVGCIPICSNVGGIPDVIQNGINGFLSDSPTEEDYYRAVKKFLELTPVERRNIKSQCMRTFSKFDITNTAKSYIDVYSKFK